MHTRAFPEKMVEDFLKVFPKAKIIFQLNCIHIYFAENLNFRVFFYFLYFFRAIQNIKNSLFRAFHFDAKFMSIYYIIISN